MPASEIERRRRMVDIARKLRGERNELHRAASEAERASERCMEALERARASERATAAERDVAIADAEEAKREKRESDDASALARAETVTLSTQLEGCQASVKKAEGTLGETEERNGAAERALVALRADLVAKRHEISTIWQGLETVRTELAAERERRTQAEGGNETLRAELAAAQKEVGEAQTKREEEKKEKNEARSEVDRMKTELEVLKRTNEQLGLKLGEKDTELKRQFDAELQAALERERLGKQELTRKCHAQMSLAADAAKVAAEKSGVENAALRDAVKAAQLQLRECEDSKRTLQEKVARLEAQLATATNNDACEEQVRHWREKYKDYNQRHGISEAALRESTKLTGRLQDEIRDLKSALALHGVHK